MDMVKSSYEKTEQTGYICDIDTILVICRPFLTDEWTDKLKCNFCFMSPDNIDIVSVIEVSKAYKKVFIEKIIADKIEEVLEKIGDKITIIENCIRKETVSSDTKVAFLASSDTHVEFMMKLAEAIPNHIFLIPDRSCKDDAAAAALEKAGKPFIEIHYKATECKELIDFCPQYIYTATDWTSEFIAVKRVIEGTAIRTIALQEGPEDWHLRFIQNGILKVLNHYRNADIFFSQGSRTMFFIRPQYFAITGTPKIDRVEHNPLPEKPRVLINCNFTYLNTKPAYERKRNMWMESVLRVCKEIGIDYIISKHPRDDSEWDDPNLIYSNAYTIKQQLIDCSIAISRFSSIPYEALARSRKAIYYNIHLEPMPTFMEDLDGEVKIVTEEEELKNILKKHMEEYPYEMDQGGQELYLNRYVGMQDGRALERVINNLSEIAENRWCGNDVLSDVLQSMIDCPKAAERKVFVFYFMPSRDLSGEYEALALAEAMAAMGHKVFALARAYSEMYGRFFELEHHKDIEYVLTRNFDDKLENEAVDYVVCVPGDEEKPEYYDNAYAISEIKNARFAVLENSKALNSKMVCEMNQRDTQLEKELADLLAEHREALDNKDITSNDILSMAKELARLDSILGYGDE